MHVKRLFVSLMVLCSVSLGATETSLAQDAITSPAAKQIGVGKPQIEPALIVLNARAARLENGKLVLSGVAPNSIMFADRPVRAAGHVQTAHLLDEWAVGSNNFAIDPPNATVSVLNRSGSAVTDAVVTLKSPKLDGDNLVFAVEILEGNLTDAEGPASVFIDIIGLPFTPLSFAGVARRTAYRSAWYAGAAAASASYYAHPRCGYYPLPPCY
ncbi:hypothetical protein LMG6001_01531 [Achromobacter insolitus]|uniref:hypothetical protein n=2 Tax=Achromobacter insolitus TaxID=217204 RepID=UPI000AF5DC87|nr:hypothetical protein [Achromobacter insolitus]CAB3947423.1 hypothetical protein LMG6001_01531 [Achromobacter insolitus]